MLLKGNIKIHNIVSGTWRSFIYSLITCALAYFINHFFLRHHFVFPSFVPTILGTALAFFIGFNNNQAYGRWWEARMIWGSLVNNSRTWARQLLYYVSANESISEVEVKDVQQKLIRRHIGFLYALKANLRKSQDTEYLQYLSDEDIQAIEGQSNIHNAILSLQSRDLEKLYQNQTIDGYKFLELNKTIITFCDDMGKSERIRNTVFPTTYNYYSRGFIWLFIYAVTMTMDDSVGLWSIVFGVLVGFVFFTIQSLGQTIMNPFEDISPGIPLNQITRTIEINLLEMLDEKDIPEPVQSVNGEYIM